MNSKLSFNAIAATLAALGATGLVACGGSAPPAQSPVQAHEVPAASAAPAEAACGAAPTESKGSAETASDNSATAGSTADTKGTSDKTNDAKSDEAKTDDAKSDSDKTADTKDDAKTKAASTKKPAAHRTATHPRKKRAGGAKSSCGAGTCV